LSVVAGHLTTSWSAVHTFVKERALGILLIVSGVSTLMGCGGPGNPDSPVICGRNSKESVYVRSLSDSQLEALYAASMKLLASTDLQEKYDDEPGHAPIPSPFVHLNARGMDTRSSDAAGNGGEVSFLLKHCMDEGIQLSVDRKEIALYYGLGGAPNLATEILWSANKESSLPAISPLVAREQAVSVSFEIPGRQPVVVSVTASEVTRLTGVRQPHALEFWVVGALSKGALKYTLEHIEHKRTITAIDGVRNSAAGTWVYLVDGIRSREHINTQDVPKVRSIRFVFEQLAGADA
jgi:hypothetical protein